MAQMINMIGKRFGRLVVIKRTSDHYYPSGRHDVCYTCQCDCGNVVDVLGIHLRSEHTISCGCFRVDTSRQAMTTHGMTNTRLHNIWKNMLERCFNHDHKNYDIYGGRGITVCDEWKDNFKSFAEWSFENGYADYLSLDRVNVDDGYSPDNCRWVTQKDQCNNTRRNINVTISNETKTLKQWAEYYGLKYGTIVSRVDRGWNPIKALTTPVRSISEHK